MRIFLCYPPVSEEYNKIRDSGLAPHLSILCIASHLKSKFSDLTFKICDGHHMPAEEMKNEIVDFEPEIIGYSVDFTNYNNAVLLADFAKSRFPDVWNVMGSNHASNLYREILGNQKSIDFISIGDGEPSMEDLVRARRGELRPDEGSNLACRDPENGDIILTEKKLLDLSKMTDVDYGLIDLAPYFALQERVMGSGFRMLQFTSQRGCVNKPLCVFCGRYTDGIRFRDPDRYAREIAYWAEKLDLTEVWDRSDSFIQSFSWLKKFCEALRKHTDRFLTGRTTFKTYARADQLLRSETIAMLKELNFRMVFIGYEAGDDRILGNIGKHATLDIYRRATRNVLENGLEIDASFIVGLPGENKESLANHISFVRELVSMGLDKIRVNRLLVLPGTPLYEAVMRSFPELQGKDSIPQDVLQEKLFMTDLYDLKEFGNDPLIFEDHLRAAAETMTGAILETGGGAEGYGYGKDRNLLSGNQFLSKK